MKLTMNEKIKNLVAKGVKIPNPETIEIGKEVDPDRISGRGVMLYSGCRIRGASTLIMDGVKLGYEAPVTLEHCQVGPNAMLNGGFFQGSVFLNNVKMGSGAHVRSGTILEEEASGAHTVGLKQTILFPFVTLGSLINFCDCFMAGGTSRKNHSEVGSSYIHFNYTPNQDKATPSLLGDVPRGVMLNQKPIFLGGQGGIVGPCRLTYGTVIAAGTIHRKDETRPDRLIVGGASRALNTVNKPGVYLNEKRIVLNNINYIGNLIALMTWYREVRTLFVSPAFPQELLDGLVEKLEMVVQERMKRLRDLGIKLVDQNPEIHRSWTELETGFLEFLNHPPHNTRMKDTFLETLVSKIDDQGKDYLSVITRMNPEESNTGTQWLQDVVDTVVQMTLRAIPSYQPSQS